MRNFAVVLIRIVALGLIVTSVLDTVTTAFFLSTVEQTYPFELLIASTVAHFVLCLAVLGAAPWIASKIAPDEDLPDSFPQPRVLFAIGLVLIGLFLALDGLAALTVVLPNTFAAISEMARDHSASFGIKLYWGSIVPPLMDVVFGTGLVLWARRAVAATSRPTAPAP